MIYDLWLAQSKRRPAENWAYEWNIDLLIAMQMFQLRSVY